MLRPNLYPAASVRNIADPNMFAQFRRVDNTPCYNRCVKLLAYGVLDHERVGLERKHLGKQRRMEQIRNADTSTTEDRNKTGVNVVRALAMDAVERAGSGHPGTAMALAPLAHVLWTRVMAYNASDPDWPDRDRFVLSAGHASFLRYSMLYLCGYGLELDDLKQFLRFGSRTPGHPERHTSGVEVSTGPLGQGFGYAVGMAISEANLRARFGNELCNHFTFVVVSDGDLMDGVIHEVASLAGHLGMGRLICIYDDNHISIDGPTELALTDDAGERFRAYGWHVDEVGEIANDVDELEAALQRAKAEIHRPSLIRLRSHIAFPAPTKMDTSAAHGSPLGADEVAATKEILDLEVGAFAVPPEVLAMYRGAGLAGAAANRQWAERVEVAALQALQARGQ
jgi:transketolase